MKYSEFRERDHFTNQEVLAIAYGRLVEDAPEEFHARFEGLCSVLLDHPEMFGYCYTQLTDIEQEQNGVYNYDRTPKFDMERIALAFRKARP